MANIHNEYAVLLQNLQDAGCDRRLIEEVLRVLDPDKIYMPGHAIRLLRKHRKTLLQQLHDDERMIDSLDYLIYKLHQDEKG